MATIIRQIAKDDNIALAKIIRDVFDEYRLDKIGTVYSDPSTDNLYELFRLEKSTYWVVEKDGELIGGCGTYPTDGLPGSCAELVKFYLKAEYRGEGIGKLLLQININTAKSNGFKALYLETFPELTSSLGLYKSLGFTFLNERLGNSGHHTCSIWMLKNL